MKKENGRVGGPPTIKGENLVGAAICLVVFMALATPIIAQGTIHIGFEEFAVETLPPFIALPGSSPGLAAAADSSAAYDGMRLLEAQGHILLSSPDSQPIAQITLHYFVPGSAVAGVTRTMDIGPTSDLSHIRVTDLGTWQTFTGQYSPAVSRLIIGGSQITVSPDGIFETPLPFALDAIDLVTIPEPSTIHFLAFGSGILGLRLVARRKNR